MEKARRETRNKLFFIYISSFKRDNFKERKNRCPENKEGLSFFERESKA